MSEHEIIAIDGPSASGKSTVARRVAKALGFTYVDSGSLYRGVTWRMLGLGIDVRDEEQVCGMLPHIEWDVSVENGEMVFALDGVRPGDALRSKAVRESVSFVARIPHVRNLVGKVLHDLLSVGPLSVEGRDIGSVVFPETPLKFYLDADPLVRARRRHDEIADKEKDSSVEDVHNALRRRDEIDSTREAAPLQIALGANVINSTAMDIDDVVLRVLEIVRHKRESSP